MEKETQRSQFHESIETMSSMLPEQQRREAIQILATSSEQPELLLDMILNQLKKDNILETRFESLGLDKKEQMISKIIKSFNQLGSDLNALLSNQKFANALTDEIERKRSEKMDSQTLSAVMIVKAKDKTTQVEVALACNTVKSTLSIINNSDYPINVKFALLYKSDISLPNSRVREYDNGLLLSFAGEEAQSKTPLRLEKIGQFLKAYETMSSDTQSMIRAIDVFHKTRAYSFMHNNEQWMPLLDSFSKEGVNMQETNRIKPLDTFTLDVNGFKSMPDKQFFLLLEAEELINEDLDVVIKDEIVEKTDNSSDSNN